MERVEGDLPSVAVEAQGADGPKAQPAQGPLADLVAHLRRNRLRIAEEWAERIAAARLPTSMAREEVEAVIGQFYFAYLEALEAGTPEAAQACTRSLFERSIPRGLEIHEVIGAVLLLRDVLTRSLFASHRSDVVRLSCILDVCEPAANRIAYAVAIGLVQEREHVIRQQQEAIRELLEVAAAHESGALDRPGDLALGAPDGAVP